MPFNINGKIEDRVLLHLVPHGINPDIFKPLPSDNKEFKEKKKTILNGKEYNFVIFYNSRNTKRKQPANIILAYRTFCDNLTKEEASKCLLLMHTEIVQEAGTNLFAVKEAFCPNYDILFSPNKLTPEDINVLYNIADVTVNVSSNEGFGLSVAESMMAGTPVIVNVTGGLQDQIGQTDENGNLIEFDINFGSNNVGKYKKHGVWVKPIWPVTRDVQGSVPTPYIFDDLCRWEDVADAYMYWYLMTPEKREACGLKGREWALGEGGLNSKNMGQQFINGMEYVFKNWTKPAPFGIYSSKDYVGHQMPNQCMGFDIPVIDKERILKEVEKVS